MNKDVIGNKLKWQAEALTNFLNDFDGMTLQDLGPHLTCVECESLANLFEAHDLQDRANALREGHALTDEDDDMEEHVELRDKLLAAMPEEGTAPNVQSGGTVVKGERIDRF